MTPPPLPEPKLMSIPVYTEEQMLQYAKDYHAAMLGPRLTDEEKHKLVAKNYYWEATEFKDLIAIAEDVERRVRGEEA